MYLEHGLNVVIMAYVQHGDVFESVSLHVGELLDYHYTETHWSTSLETLAQ